MGARQLNKLSDAGLAGIVGKGADPILPLASHGAHGVGVIGDVAGELAALLRQIVGHDAGAVALENIQQTGGLKEEAAEHQLLACKLIFGQLFQLVNEGCDQRNIGFFVDKMGCFDDFMADGRRDDVHMLRRNGRKAAHGAAVVVIQADSLADGGVGDGDVQDLLQLFPDEVILAAQEVRRAAEGAVLGMDEGDGGALALPLLAEALEGVAHGGDGDGAEHLVIGAVGLVLHDGLHDGAGKGRQVGAGVLDLHLSAPESHRDAAGGVDQLLRPVGGDPAHRPFSRGGAGSLNGLLRCVAHGAQFLQNKLQTHNTLLSL